MEVLDCKDNANTVFGKMINIEEGNKNFYLLFTCKCKPSLKTKLKGTKGYDNSHNEQDSIKSWRSLVA